nr:hypothetical protein GCM10020092_003490 [Actinoplanes digitatis]
MHYRVEALGQRRVRGQALGDVGLDEREAGLGRQVRDVVPGARDEVVDRDNRAAPVDEGINHV